MANTDNKDTESFQNQVLSLRNDMNTVMTNYNNFYKQSNLGKYGKGVQKLSTGVSKRVAIGVGIAAVAILVALCIAKIIPMNKAMSAASAAPGALKGDPNSTKKIEDIVKSNSNVKIEPAKSEVKPEVPANKVPPTPVSGVSNITTKPAPAPASSITQTANKTDTVLNATPVQTAVTPATEETTPVNPTPDTPAPAPQPAQGVASQIQEPAPTPQPVQNETSQIQQPAPVPQPVQQTATTQFSFDIDGPDCRLEHKYQDNMEMGGYTMNRIIFNNGKSLPAVTTAMGPTYTAVNKNGTAIIYMYKNGSLVNTRNRVTGISDKSLPVLLKIAREHSIN